MNPIETVNALLDVPYLAPFRFTADNAKAVKELRIYVRFSNHCFSEAFDPARHSPDEPVIMDGRKRRVFCPDRHRLSFRLPGLIRGLATPGARVHETAARRNWM